MLCHQREYVVVISPNQIWLTLINMDNVKRVTIICAAQLSALTKQHSSGETREERPSPSGFLLFVACHFPFLSSDFLSIFYCLLMQGSKNTSKAKRQRQHTPAAFMRAFLIHSDTHCFINPCTVLIQNAAECALTRTNIKNHVTPVSASLYWLTEKSRLEFHNPSSHLLMS